MKDVKRNKIRINITIDSDLKDRIDAKGLTERGKLSQTVEQLLEQYLRDSSINALENTQRNFIAQEIEVGLSDMNKKIDRIEKKMLPLVMANTFKSISDMNMEEFSILQEHLHVWSNEHNMDIQSPNDFLMEVHALVSKIKKDDNKPEELFIPVEETKEDLYENVEDEEYYI